MTNFELIDFSKANPMTLKNHMTSKCVFLLINKPNVVCDAWFNVFKCDDRPALFTLFYKFFFQSKTELTPDCLNLAVNSTRKSSLERVCINYWWSVISLGNISRHENFDDWSWVVLNCCTWFVLWCLVTTYGAYSRIKAEELDSMKISVSDFSVCIKGLPIYKNVTNHDKNMKLDRSIQSYFHKEGYVVTQVNMVYDTKEYLKLVSKYCKFKKLWMMRNRD